MTVLTIGDPVPWFTLPSTSNPKFHFDTVGGYYVVLFFFGSARHRNSAVILQGFSEQQSRFSDLQIPFFGISVDSGDTVLAELVEQPTFFKLMWDFEGTISRQYGVVQTQGEAVVYQPTTFVLDPTLRVLQVFPVESPEDHVDQVMRFLESLPVPPPHRMAERQAPVVLIPRVFDPEFCQYLIQLFDADGGEDSGFMREVDGKTVAITDYGFKKRRDLNLADGDPALLEKVNALVLRRIKPEIEKVFQFSLTRFERHVVACYEAKNRGFFNRHRDNTTKGTAHRRFAMTLNLNTGGYEGGCLWFPEYGTQLYRPDVGEAVIFSCSLLHEVTPVTSGRRFALLSFFYGDEDAKLREQNRKYLATHKDNDDSSAKMEEREEEREEVEEITDDRPPTNSPFPPTEQFSQASNELSSEPSAADIMPSPSPSKAASGFRTKSTSPKNKGFQTKQKKPLNKLSQKSPKRILFLHPNFPAQFRHLAKALTDRSNYKVVFGTARQEGEIPGVRKLIYPPSREVAAETHFYVRPLEEAVLQGQAVYRMAQKLKTEGFIPDIIYGHSGWGPTLFMKDMFPEAKLLCYFEWFYQAHGSDSDFDPAYPLNADNEARIRIRNASILLDLYACDQGLTPTHWQQQQFPPEFHSKLKVLHDGIDTEFFRPNPGAKLVLPRIDLDLSHVEELVTYVARGMEPYRGFPQFVEAIALVQQQRPQCHVVIVGEDRVAYGSPRSDGKTYKQFVLETVPLDLDRVHFTGYLPYPEHLQVLQASSVHVYLTYPFVLSWSLLEALSTACLVVASDTSPVKEVIEDGVNGLLVDFFSPQKIADRILEGLNHPDRMTDLRTKARETILKRYNLATLLPQQIGWINSVLLQSG